MRMMGVGAGNKVSKRMGMDVQNKVGEKLGQSCEGVYLARPKHDGHVGVEREDHVKLCSRCLLPGVCIEDKVKEGELKLSTTNEQQRVSMAFWP
jgi:hypothetical protein